VIKVDTRDILFLCGGAFVDLDRQVAERKAQSSWDLGIQLERSSPGNEEGSSVPDEPLIEAEAQDLIKYGLIPEFVGRFPVLCAFQALYNKSYRECYTSLAIP